MIKSFSKLKSGFIALATLCFFQFSNAQNFHIQEDFNDSLLPPSWANTAISGSQAFSFGLDASASNPGNNNIDGTALVFFDDDVLGATSTNNTAELLSAAFDNSSDTVTYLEFDYNFREINGIADSFIVDVFDGTQWQNVLRRSTNDCGSWTSPTCQLGWPHALVDISAYKNSQCRVRFRYTDGNDWGWYVGIDNIEVYEPILNDLEIVSIDSLRSGCNGSSANQLGISIRNNGIFSQSNFNVSYSINNSSPITETVTANLPPNTTLGYVFSTNPATVTGNNAITAYSDLSNDLDRSNDSSSIQLIRTVTQNIPYYDDFESSTQLWQIYGQNSSWQRGVPFGNVINSALSGQNAFVTNLNGSHNAQELSYLESPCFDLTNITNPVIISFSINYELETNIDRLRIEYTLDGGNSYSTVLAHPTFIDQNWHNNQAAFWSGNSNGNWIQMKALIDSLNQASDISFRFVFQSDGSNQFEGVAIDDFRLFEQPTYDLAVTAIQYPIQQNQNTDNCGLYKENLVFQLSNPGARLIDTTFCKYVFNGQASTLDTFIINLPQNQTRTITSLKRFDFSRQNINQFHIVCELNGDPNQLNDTLKSDSITNSNIEVKPLPYLENFEGGLGAYRNFPLERTPFYTDEWTRTGMGNSSFYWNRNSGSINQLGPVIAADRDTSIKQFFNRFGTYRPNIGSFAFSRYFGSVNIGDTSTLNSPCLVIDSNNLNPFLQFYYHRYGQNNQVAPLMIDVLSNGEWERIDSLVGADQSLSTDLYKKKNISLSKYRSRNIRIRFVSKHIASIQSGMRSAIDQISVSSGQLNNIENQMVPHIDLHQELDSTNSDSLAIEMVLINFSDSIILPSSLRLQYEIIDINNQSVVRSGSELNRNSIVPFQSDSLNPVKSYVHSFNKIFIPQAGDFLIKTYYDKLDEYTHDDTVHYLFSKNSSVLPYEEDFEPFSYFLGNPSCNYGAEFYKYGYDFIDFNIRDTVRCGIITAGPLNGKGFAIGGSVLPYIDFNNYNQITLEYNYVAGTGDLFVLAHDLDSLGAPPVKVDSLISPPNGLSYVKRSVNLSQLIGKRVRLEFMSTWNFAQNYVFDDIRIFDPTITNLQSLKTLAQTLAVYPNPSHGKFMIEVPDEMIGERYEIIDISGRVLESSTFKSTTENIQIEADKGVYIIRIQEHGIHQKVVVY